MDDDLQSVASATYIFVGADGNIQQTIVDPSHPLVINTLESLNSQSSRRDRYHPPVPRRPTYTRRHTAQDETMSQGTRSESSSGLSVQELLDIASQSSPPRRRPSPPKEAPSCDGVCISSDLMSEVLSREDRTALGELVESILLESESESQTEPAPTSDPETSSISEETTSVSEIESQEVDQQEVKVEPQESEVAQEVKSDIVSQESKSELAHQEVKQEITHQEAKSEITQEVKQEVASQESEVDQEVKSEVTHQESKSELTQEVKQEITQETHQDITQEATTSRKAVERTYVSYFNDELYTTQGSSTTFCDGKLKRMVVSLAGFIEGEPLVYPFGDASITEIGPLTESQWSCDWVDDAVRGTVTAQLITADHYTLRLSDWRVQDQVVIFEDIALPLTLTYTAS